MKTDARSLDATRVCSLPDEQLRDRLAMIRREILPHATRREALADGMAFDLPHTPEMQKTLDDLVAFERSCCGGLSWILAQPSSGTLRLTIRGLAPDSELFRTMEG
jgi:hypothetical protein